jgi:hypothetical protein
MSDRLSSQPIRRRASLGLERVEGRAPRRRRRETLDLLEVSGCMRSLAVVRIDRYGYDHDDRGRFSAVVWRGRDLAGRRVALTHAALRHARGEDEADREVRMYLSALTIAVAVSQGKRYADAPFSRERLTASDLRPSRHLAVAVDFRAHAGTVVTAYALRRIPNAWRQL